MADSRPPLIVWGVPLWDEALARWLAGLTPNTAASYRQAVRSFFHFCPRLPPDVRRGDVMAWREMLADAGLADATQNARLAGLEAMFGFFLQPAGASEDGLVERNPVAGIRRARIDMYSRAVKMSLDEYKRIILVVPVDTPRGRRDRALLIAYVFTGRRRREILELRWGDLTFEADMVTYRYRGKGGKVRTRELVPQIVDALRLWKSLAGHPADERIFPMDPSNAAKRLKRYAKIARVSQRSAHIHGLRHLAAELEESSGASVEELQEFLDHTSPATTQIYRRRMTVPRDKRASRKAALLAD